MRLLANGLSHVESQRVWCSLEKCLFFYESDRSSEPLGKIEVTDMISLGVNRTDMLTGPSSSDRYVTRWHIPFFFLPIFHFSFST